MAGAYHSNLDPWGMFAPRPQRQQTPYTSEAALPRAIEQQGIDYSNIMRGYQDVLNNPNPGQNDILAEYRRLLGDTRGLTYEESPEFREAFANARALSEHGGITDGEAADLRSRGISPIRAAYANMQRDMDRNKRLSGGSSVNFNAAASRMAREMAQMTSDATQAVNADIAGRRQQGRLTAAPLMSSMGQGASDRMLDYKKTRLGGMGSILDSMNSIYNRGNDARMEALRGMASLYGTTPALVNTYGNQVAQNTGLYQNQEAMSVPRRTGPSGGAAVWGR